MRVAIPLGPIVICRPLPKVDHGHSRFVVAVLLLKLRNGALRIRECRRIVFAKSCREDVLLLGGPSNGEKISRHKKVLSPDVEKITGNVLLVCNSNVTIGPQSPDSGAQIWIMWYHPR